MAYQCRGHGDEALRIGLEALASQYLRYGYLLHGMLKREVLVMNAKRTLGTTNASAHQTTKAMAEGLPGSIDRVATAMQNASVESFNGRFRDEFTGRRSPNLAFRMT